MKIGESKRSSAPWKNKAILVLYFAMKELPDWVAYRILAPTAATVTMFFPSVITPVMHNMRQVTGANSNPFIWVKNTWGVLHHTSISWADHIFIPKLDLKKFLERVGLKGIENLREAIDSGRGVIMVGGHLSGYFLILQILLELGIKALCPTEPLANEALNKLVTKLRRSQGVDCQTLGGNTMKNVIRLLRAGGVVILPVDRDIQRSSRVSLRFLGRKTIMPIGAAKLAKKYGCLLVVTTWERRGPYSFQVVFQPALDPNDFETPEELARAALPLIEDQIRNKPEQWLPIEWVWGGGGDN